MPSLPKLLFRCRRGATAIEYGLMVALIAMVVVGGISALGNGGRGMWALINTRMPTVG